MIDTTMQVAGKKQQEIVDIVAKILATEDITVVRAACRTASFDIRNRVLRLPIWKNLLPVVEEMLMCHEVGHALYTTEKYGEAINKDRFIKSYLNVLEDVRIERFMKEKFPGSKKTFFQGYTELQNRDFFEIKNANFKRMLLIDKINLYYKAGFNCGVTFNEKERDFLKRAEKTQTEAEVVKLAHDVYKYSKDVLKEQQKQDNEEQFGDPIYEESEDGSEIPDDAEITEVPNPKKPKKDKKDKNQKPKKDKKDKKENEESDDTSNSSDGDEDDSKEDKPEGSESSGDDESDEKPTDETNEGSGDGDEDEDEGSSNKDESNDEGGDGEAGDGTSKDGEVTKPTPEPEIKDEDLVSKTDESFNENIKDLADTTVDFQYYNIGKHLLNPIVPYKKILDDTKDMYVSPSLQTILDKSKREWTDVVSYLVKEFELKKAASTLRRTQVAKTGSLDETKLYAYKIKKDLFKTFTVVPKGKNHGIVMLVDWSGSMENTIVDCIKQVINLAMFCQRENMPFQVFAFTSAYSEENNITNENRVRVQATEKAVKEPTIFRGELGFHLLELFNGRMSSNDFKTMVSRLLNGQFRSTNNYRLSGTPLNEALIFMADYLGPWKLQNNVQKLTFITLTDGQGSSLATNQHLVGYNGTTRTTIKNLMKDPVTKKSFDIGEAHCSSHQTVAILEMIKARYNCSMLGFYIMSGHDYKKVISDNSRLNPYNNPREVEVHVDKMRKQIQEGRFASVENITGRDRLFVLRKEDTKITGDIENLNIDSEMTSLKAAKVLAKELRATKTSRVLLSQFIESIA